jgi:hypothetical protein
MFIFFTSPNGPDVSWLDKSSSHESIEMSESACRAVAHRAKAGPCGSVANDRSSRRLFDFRRGVCAKEG